MIETDHANWSPIGPTFGGSGSPACSATPRPFSRHGDLVVDSETRETVDLLRDPAGPADGHVGHRVVGNRPGARQRDVGALQDAVAG